MSWRTFERSEMMVEFNSNFANAHQSGWILNHLIAERSDKTFRLYGRIWNKLVAQTCVQTNLWTFTHIEPKISTWSSLSVQTWWLSAVSLLWTWRLKGRRTRLDRLETRELARSTRFRSRALSYGKQTSSLSSRIDIVLYVHSYMQCNDHVDHEYLNIWAWPRNGCQNCTVLYWPNLVDHEPGHVLAVRAVATLTPGRVDPWTAGHCIQGHLDTTHIMCNIEYILYIFHMC